MWPLHPLHPLQVERIYVADGACIDHPHVDPRFDGDARCRYIYMSYCNPEGESVVGCLAALLAPHRSLWTCSSLAPCHSAQNAPARYG